MKDTTGKILSACLARIPELLSSKEIIVQAYETILNCYRNGGKLLICGNGGSAADSEHIVGELMKGFLKRREILPEHRDKIKGVCGEEADYIADRLQQALPAISLVSQSAIATAFANDVCGDMVFAQQVFGYGRPGDVLIGLSTSGNAKNVVFAAKVAQSLSMKIIGMTGKTGGELKKWSNVTITAPSTETFLVQEYHVSIYHALCAMIEEEIF